MQKFTKTKIALAVGASLMTAAGVAQAAAPTAFGLRAAPSKPALITSTAAGNNTTHRADARSLYDGTGYNGTLTVQLQFTAPAAGVSTAGNANGQAAQISAGADGFVVNGVTNGLTNTATVGTVPTTTTDDVSVYTGATAAAGKTLKVTNLGFTANVGGPTIGTGGVTSTATALIGVQSGAAPAAFRMSTTGTLQWIADIATGATAANWLDVHFDVNAITGTSAGTGGAGLAYNAINAANLAVDATGGSTSGLPVAVPVAGTGVVTAVSTASSTPITAAAAQLVWNSVVPSPIVATRATNGLIDGVTIDTLTPLAAFATANIGVSAHAVNNTGSNAVTGSNNIAATVGAATSSANANGSAVTVANATGTAKYAVTLTTPATTANWSSGPLVAGQNYTSDNFNTGMTGATLPFDINVVDSGATLAYSTVFDAAGLPVSAAVAGATHLANLRASVVDGASPVVSKAVYDSAANNLTLSFSEQVQSMAVAFGAGDLREVAENVIIGGNSLAALNLNAGGTLTGPTFNTTNGVTDVTIGGVPKTGVVALASTIAVNPGLSFAESNDANFSPFVNRLDNSATLINGIQLAGGIVSATSAVEAAAAVAGLTVTAPTPTIVFGNGTRTSANGTGAAGASVTATAVTTGTLLSGLVVNFTTPVAAAAPVPNGVLTATSLDKQIVVTIDGSSFTSPATPAQFQFFPSGAALNLNAAGTQLSVTLPTALIYQKLGKVTGVTVEYLNMGTSGTVGSGNALATSPKLLTNKAAITTVTPNIAAGGLVVQSGAEKVIMPQAAIANTLYTQSIQATLANGAAAFTAGSNWDGAVVKAYVAKFNDVASTVTSSVTIDNGKISNNGTVDRVAQDLAIEYTAGQKAALEAALGAALDAVATAKTAVPGVSAAVAAAPLKPVVAYVQLTRSNDAVPSTNGTTVNSPYGAANTGAASTQGAVNSLQARARLSTVSTDAAFNKVDPIYQVTIDAKTGAITGRLTGNLSLTATTVDGSGGNDRGLRFVNTATGALEGNTTNALAGAATVSPTGGLDLLIGVDAQTAANKANLTGAFVLLDAQLADGTHVQLTSANPDAANYMPFDANLINGKGTRTILSNVAAVPGKVAAGTTPAVAFTPAKFDVTRLKSIPLANSSAWQLLALGSPDKAATVAATGVNFPRTFVGENAAGAFKSMWTNSVSQGNLAMALKGNTATLATELSDGSTLSTITAGTSFVNGAAALALVEDTATVNSGNTNTITVQQAPATPVITPTLTAGWSLVTVPASGTFTASGKVPTAAEIAAGTAVSIYKSIDAIIRVGAQAGTQMTWVKGDPTPALTAGEAVFVYSPAGGAM